MSHTGLFSAFSPPHALWGAVWLVAMAAVPCQAQTAGANRLQARQPLSLRATPDGVSRIVAKVPAQAHLEQLPGRFGPWVQARTAQGVVGWALILDVSGVQTTGPEPAAAGVAANSVKPVEASAATPAEAPSVAEQRLLLVQTYRSDSEAARRFAFRSALELVKLPPATVSGHKGDKP